MGNRVLLFVFFLSAYGLRLVFGLFGELWGDDELQIFLIGLQYYTTGVWPLYGPDVVYTQTRVPGGLQGLLIAGPMWVVSQPEAPYVLLSLLSFAALCLLGWYITRRIPDVPRWFLWTWIFFSPWTLDLSGHIVNPSYVLFGAVLFFVAVFELLPALSVGAVPRSAAWFALGFGLLWVYQLHLSASLLFPIAAIVVVVAARASGRSAAVGLLWCAAGSALSGATLVPTILRDGVAAVAASTGANMAFDPGSLIRIPQVIAQYLSFGSFELPRFLGASTAERLTFLARYLWAAPFIVVAVVIGVTQAGVLFAFLFVRSAGPCFRAVRVAVALLLAFLCVSFMFSVRPPASHAFYVVMPVVVIYAFYCWTTLWRFAPVRWLAVALVVAGAIGHVAIAARNFTDRSLYVNRPLVVRAIEERDYRLVGERRPEREQWPRRVP